MKTIRSSKTHKRKPADRPVPVILTALAKATGGWDTTMDEMATIYPLIPQLMQTVRTGRIDERGVTSIESIARVVTDEFLAWSRDDDSLESPYQERKQIKRALEGAKLDPDVLEYLEGVSAKTGFFIGLAFAYDALKGRVL